MRNQPYIQNYQIRFNCCCADDDDKLEINVKSEEKKKPKNHRVPFNEL